MRTGEVRYLLTDTFYRMTYTAWGDPAFPPVVCVHGLTRNGRDFDLLAAALADRFWVVCPDLPGRGQSDWLPEAALYQPPTYVIALAHLLAAIGRPVLWVGTSLGGICGMMIAAATGHPITRMVLNDIGARIEQAAIARIREYLSLKPMPVFPDLVALERHLRNVYAPFGPMTDAQWTHMAETSARTLADGRVTLHYDPKLGEPMRMAEPAEVDLWPVWNRIRIPVLVIRGEASDLLSAEIQRQMEATGARGMVVPGVGHAPSLNDEPTISAIQTFLEGD
ncbi:MAG: alpha/beta hydrolase [Acetobacteraceae bacterium]|nr:alpha/beta hydrolase [Acetobacteraceae bacterium]